MTSLVKPYITEENITTAVLAAGTYFAATRVDWSRKSSGDALFGGWGVGMLIGLIPLDFLRDHSQARSRWRKLCVATVVILTVETKYRYLKLNPEFITGLNAGIFASRVIYCLSPIRKASTS